MKKSLWFAIFIYLDFAFAAIVPVNSFGAQSAESLFNQAEQYFYQGDMAKAVAAYSQVLDASPSILAARIGKARCLSRLDRETEALGELDKVLAIQANHRDALLAKGSILSKQGKQDAAIYIFNAILKNDPNDELAWYNLGTSQRETNQLDAALDSLFKVQDLLLRKKQEVPPEFHSMLYYQIGMIYQSKNDLEKAVSYLRKAIQASPWSENPQYQLGMILARTGQAQESRQWLDSFKRIKEINKKIIQVKDAAARSPQSATPYIALGQLYLSLGDLRSAENVLLTALDRHPGNSHAFNYLGLVYIKNQKLDAARDAFLSAIQKDERNIQAIVNLASLELQTGNLDEAEQLYNQALQLNPAFSIAQQGLLQVQKRRIPSAESVK
ncbi:MAG: tetratricopeptide repeat protein [Candidatus Omnitrophota bacterium]